MTNRQKAELRLSDARAALRKAIEADVDAMSVEKRSEHDTQLERHMASVASAEVELRAAIVDEAHVPEPETRAEDRYESTSEDRELRSLIGKASLGRHLMRHFNGEADEGAELELRQAFDVPAGRTPWAMLLDPVELETRDDAITQLGGPYGTQQEAIIARLFARSATAALGVAMPSVGVGRKMYPVITGGETATVLAPEAAKEATSMTISTVEITPSRLHARYRFRIEDTAALAGLEPALRRDMRMALSDALDKQILSGSGTGSNFSGFLATPANGGLPALADPTQTADFATYIAATVTGVDGFYANSEGECNMVVPVHAYRHAATLLASGTAVSAGDYLGRKLGRYQSSAQLPNGASIQEGIIASGPSLLTAVAPVWEGVTLVRDPYTNASSGVINLDLFALYGFEIIRPAGFQRIKFKIT